MELKKAKLEELIGATQKIIEAQQDDKKKLLFGLTEENKEEITELNELLDTSIIEDPDKSYDLFYNGIQKFLLSVLPKDPKIRKPILELKSILLTGNERENINSGKRGADSRMTYMASMENVIDIITEWSMSPHDYMKLGYLLLNKNKELGYIPQTRDISDYI